MAKQMIIESFGSPDTTRLFLDGEEIKSINKIEFSAEAGEILTKLNVGYLLYNDNIDIHKEAENITAAENILLNRIKESTNEISNKTFKETHKETSTEGIE